MYGSRRFCGKTVRLSFCWNARCIPISTAPTAFTLPYCREKNDKDLERSGYRKAVIQKAPLCERLAQAPRNCKQLLRWHAAGFPKTRQACFREPRRGPPCLAAARSRSRSDSPPDYHSLRSRRFATSRGRLSLNPPKKGKALIELPYKGKTTIVERAGSWWSLTAIGSYYCQRTDCGICFITMP